MCHGRGWACPGAGYNDVTKDHLDGLHPDHDVGVFTQVQHSVDGLLTEVREVWEESVAGVIVAGEKNE